MPEEEEEWVPSGCVGFFGGGRTKFGGLKSKMTGIFSRAIKINYCLLIISNLVRFSCWNFKSWVVNCTIGLMIKISPKGIDFGALIYIIWPSVNNVCGDNYFYLNLILPNPIFI